MAKIAIYLEDVDDDKFRIAFDFISPCIDEIKVGDLITPAQDFAHQIMEFLDSRHEIVGKSKLQAPALEWEI